MSRDPAPPRATVATDAPEGGDAFAPTASRPQSLWPESTRPAELPSSHFANSRFDPQAEERARVQAQAAAAFDLCHPALALRAVLLVQLVLAIAALAGADTVAQWGARQAAFAFGGVAGTLVWLVAVCALRPLLARSPAPLRGSVVLAIGALVAVGAWWPLAWAELVHAPNTLGWVAMALTGASLAALLWAWLELRARIWHPASASARLAELQSRIRPHFLFNALNTALALVRVDPTRAEAVLEDLAQLFRVALADAGASVSLEEEIDLARRYLDIEQVRFGSRLVVQWRIDERCHAARVPPLVLQPLVENAVRHGVEPLPRGGWVRVEATRQRGQVVVLVSNRVGGADDPPGAPGHGMALHNIRERLRLLHDVAAQCDVWRESEHGEDVFRARIVLPAP
jgi:two-component system sensor histidine kinase AlgZ